MAEVASSRTGDSLPPELTTLLTATDESGRDEAWASFVERYNLLLLKTVHSFSDHYDAAMDRYAFVLEELGQDGYRRLRTYAADGRGEFSTWLVVVTRRLCEDYRRRKYGREQAGNGATVQTAKQQLVVRKRLADFIGEHLEPATTPDSRSVDPEYNLRRAELYTALETALQRLDVRDRLLFKLRFEYDLSAKNIARLMAYPSPFHVYRRIRSRLQILRKILIEMGFEDARP